ncbi:MAG: DUF2271 domain-containing protein [Bacteroidota bacterium]
MKKITKIILPILGLFIWSSSFVLLNPESSTQQYKCMVQLKNYRGHGAYIIVSVLDKNKEYVKTLRVLGDDEEWYPDLSEWWSFRSKNDKPDIDGITGATIAGGERSIFVLEIDEALIGEGNSLRFETAVEDQEYHTTDLEVPMTKEALNGTFEGSGYIRYVRMIANK